jgi:TonB family protein
VFLKNGPNQAQLAGKAIRVRPLFLFALFLFFVVILVPSTAAQTKTTRKLVYKEAPGYPLTLREAHIGGIVRLEIVISPKGTVDSVSPLGGNPVLIEAASSAVRKWKYVPAENETKTQVEFTFDPKR